MRADPHFQQLLKGMSDAALDGSSYVTYGIMRDLRLAYVNKAWDAFARENGGERVIAEWPIGRNIIEAVPEALREFYIELYNRCLTSRAVQEFDYECSSPTIFRLFRMRLCPLRGGEGILVCNTLRVNVEHESPLMTAFGELDYRDEAGWMHVCCHCRRVQRRDLSTWDWVPRFVQTPPPNISHGLCGMCLDYHYPV